MRNFAKVHMTNSIKITRVAGEGTISMVMLKEGRAQFLEFDLADQDAISRVARLLRELIPELGDWRAPLESNASGRAQNR